MLSLLHACEQFLQSCGYETWKDSMRSVDAEYFHEFSYEGNLVKCPLGTMTFRLFAEAVDDFKRKLDAAMKGGE